MDLITKVQKVIKSQLELLFVIAKAINMEIQQEQTFQFENPEEFFVTGLSNHFQKFGKKIELGFPAVV